MSLTDIGFGIMMIMHTVILSLFQDGEYLGACSEDEAISNSETKNTAELAPPDSLFMFVFLKGFYRMLLVCQSAWAIFVLLPLAVNNVMKLDKYI